ncbi:hypothetical protein BS47DRAFT_1358939 [Hydnum rufescens UP504]|uniref:Uncharacterized protein n=1 Tax=Hydnum rufescens UP504 TaxID=1448309 RepID=A0A9P6B6I7_9AGAM|nr:hypothetical protein BS47DRAFT_1358939 [Hydnum rufescens UP504]
MAKKSRETESHTPAAADQSIQPQWTKPCSCEPTPTLRTCEDTNETPHAKGKTMMHTNHGGIQGAIHPLWWLQHAKEQPSLLFLCQDVPSPMHEPKPCKPKPREPKPHEPKLRKPKPTHKAQTNQRTCKDSNKTPKIGSHTPAAAAMEENGSHTPTVAGSCLKPQPAPTPSQNLKPTTPSTDLG